MVRPLIIYGSETLYISNLEHINKVERRSLRAILRPRKTEEGFRLRPTEELYKGLEDTESVIRRRRLQFLK